MSELGPCSGCGIQCEGEPIVGTIALYVCPACEEESDANWTGAVVGRKVRRAA